MLKYKIETTHRVDYNDFDQAATAFLKSKNIALPKGMEKNGYECVAQSEWGNDSSHSFTVEPKIVEDGWADKYGPYPRDILNWMCGDGLIPKGKYYIDVCW